MRYKALNPIGYTFNSPVVTKAVERLKELIMRVNLELSVGLGRACWHISNLLNSNGKDYLCNESYFPSVCWTLSPSWSLLPKQILKTFNLYSKYLKLSYNNILKVTNILISKERCPELNFSTLTNHKFNSVTARCINTFSQTCVVCIYKKKLKDLCNLRVLFPTYKTFQTKLQYK